MNTFLRSLILLLSAFLPVMGQDGSGDVSKREVGRRFSFACLAIPEGLKNPAKVLVGGAVIEVELDAYMASRSLEIPKDGIIRLVREVKDPTSARNIRFAVLVEAKIPDTIRNALIILAPLAKPDGDRILQAKVQDLASFKGGDRLFINLSDTDIGVRIGDAAVSVTARKSNIYKSPNLSEPANLPIVYSFYHPEERKWKLLTASTVVVMPTRREICVFKNGTRLGKVKKHNILFPVESPTP